MRFGAFHRRIAEKHRVGKRREDIKEGREQSLAYNRGCMLRFSALRRAPASDTTDAAGKLSERLIALHTRAAAGYTAQFFSLLRENRDAAQLVAEEYPYMAYMRANHGKPLGDISQVQKALRKGRIGPLLHKLAKGRITPNWSAGCEIALYHPEAARAMLLKSASHRLPMPVTVNSGWCILNREDVAWYRWPELRKDGRLWINKDVLVLLPSIRGPV